MANENAAPQQPVQPSYEDLARMYNELLQQRAFEEAKTRLAFCIEVVKLKKDFPAKYIDAVVKEIMTILPMDGLDPNKLMTKKTTKKAKEDEEE